MWPYLTFDPDTKALSKLVTKKLCLPPPCPHVPVGRGWLRILVNSFGVRAAFQKSLVALETWGLALAAGARGVQGGLRGRDGHLHCCGGQSLWAGFMLLLPPRPAWFLASWEIGL